MIRRPLLPMFLPPSFPNQHGMALIMALVILLILTILGVTAMTTSSLEEKMSGNTQEQNRAFQAAESGINKVLVDPNALVPNGSYSPSPYSFDSGRSGTAAVKVKFEMFAPPGRRSGSYAYSATQFQGAHFDITSTGTTVTNAKSVHHQRVELIVPKEQ